MDKLRVFQIATIGLLLLNVLLLGFIFFGPHVGGGQQPLRAMDHFDMDEAQHEQFHTLARAHGDQMRTANDRQTELLEAYFLQLATDAAATPRPLPPEITALETEKINSTYQHLLDVKELLRPEQKEAYPVFVKSILNRILIKKGKKHPSPKKRRDK